MNIDEIKKLTEKQVNAMAESWEDVKGHRVYFVDLGGNFGYSALVFCEGHHIHYANDYELHHHGKTHQELHDWYMQTLPHKLFTEEELMEPTDDYGELTRKEHFLRNYYPMRRDYVTMFYIGKPSEEQEAAEKAMYPSHVAFAYFDDPVFVRHMADLLDALHAANDPLRDYEHAKSAFKHEMFNHEYPINWQGDWDVINCFTKVEYKGDGTEIDQTGWSADIKRAYRDAAHEVSMACDW